ncbi:MAG TPA: right-handed parallel beta-helix repeat-containing protein [Sedimentisphaerales bacterium]|nr:right-handed parallel beta-helix repeat-containing protein [Sedimentisphaerales bacterium]
MKYHLSIIAFLMPLALGQAAELHVAITGSDANPGTQAAPLRTIQRAAGLAQPGDTVTVHAGVYRERVNPPRGGESASKRIVYQAAFGERVVITGSEVVKNWEKVQDDVWKATLPNTFFGGFNPYTNRIQGDWFQPKGPREHHTGAVYLNGDWLGEAAKLDEVLKPAGALPLWFGRVDQTNTTLWAQFKGVNPNAQRVEINTRQTVFYPEKPGINYITVRGFTLRHAATQWAPPTAEQMGLIGTHWSKGWIIENNTISHSKCTGIALGKYGDQWDNTSAWRAEGYVETIQRALTNGWNMATVGSHLVRNNDISHCEQAGVVGSLGCSFSVVTGNNIHDIHVQRLFGGVEMAGIKFHGAIDVEISRNHLYRCEQGIWLDWMAQGARVSGNLLHDNLERDLFFEANHGPFLVDNNVCLSPVALWAWSDGGAYVHNLFAGEISTNTGDDRTTPFHQAHSTAIAGMHKFPSCDDRYYNNLFMRSGSLEKYDHAHLPMWMDGNVYFQGAKSSKHENAPILRTAADPALALVEKNDGFYLTMTLATALGSERPSRPVTSARLGKASISGCAFENPDGSPITIGTDYFGKPRNAANPTPGPFETPGTGMLTMKVWPLASVQETNSNIPTSTVGPVRLADVVYGRKHGVALTMDVIIPAKQNGAAVIWVVSGGFQSHHSWCEGEQFIKQMKMLIDRGYTIFAVVHGCVPRYTIPDYYSDVRRAIRFIRHNARTYKIDPERIGMSGLSAGGVISLMMGATAMAGDPKVDDPVERESTRLQAIGCFFPASNLYRFNDSGENVIPVATRNNHLAAYKFCDFDPGDKVYVPITDEKRIHDLLVEYSPITHVTADDSPTLIVHGDKDSLVPMFQASDMIDKLKDKGVAARLVVAKGKGHTWEDMWTNEMKYIADWFDVHLK